MKSTWWMRAFRWLKALWHWLSGTSSSLEVTCARAYQQAAHRRTTAAVNDASSKHRGEATAYGHHDLPQLVHLLRYITLLGPLLVWLSAMVLSVLSAARAWLIPAADQPLPPSLATYATDTPETVAQTLLHVAPVAVYRVDRILLYSQQLHSARQQLESATNAADVLAAVDKIVSTKHMHSSSTTTTDTDAASLLSSAPCLATLHYACLQINAVSRLLADVDARTLVKYDSANVGHERRLLELWQLCTDDRPLSGRKSTDWQRIGFQGTDPATDFRGMGMLGLDQLLHFVRRHRQCARYTLAIGAHHQAWYSWAIVGINITSYAMSLLRSRRLQWFLFSALVEADATVLTKCTAYAAAGKQHEHSHGIDAAIDAVAAHLRDSFHELYCFLFATFNARWVSEMIHGRREDVAATASTAAMTDSKSASAAKYLPPIMEFPRVFREFQRDFETRLMGGDEAALTLHTVRLTLDQLDHLHAGVSPQ